MTRTSLAILAVAPLAALSGCVGGCGSEPVDSSSTYCSVEITDTWPASGSTDAFFRGPIEFALSDPDPTAVLSVQDAPGTSWRSDDDETVYFQPDAPLEAQTTYVATLSYCRGQADVSFTTSELGPPLDDPAALVGAVYTLNLDGARMVEPPDLGPIIQPYLVDAQELLQLGVISADGGQLEIRGALLDDETGTQDLCLPSVDFPAADFQDDPYFQLGPELLSLQVEGISVAVQGMLLSGAFAPDGSWFGGGAMAGLLDTRSLAGLLEDEGADTGSDGSICELVSGFGVDCQDCGGGEIYCLAVEIHDLTGSRIDGAAPLEHVALSDCHADCPSTYDTGGAYTNPDCAL